YSPCHEFTAGEREREVRVEEEVEVVMACSNLRHVEPYTMRTHSRDTRHPMIRDRDATMTPKQGEHDFTW
ncbi:MAG: hypothetical protein WCK33_09600, partial [Phycisphaerae bacterium]